MTTQNLQPMRLLPLRGHSGAVKPRIGSLPGATQSIDDLRGRMRGNLILETHGETILKKKKSAMRKITLAKCPHCRHITRMTTNDTNYRNFNIILKGISRWFSVTAISIESAMADMKEAFGEDVELATYNVK